MCVVFVELRNIYFELMGVWKDGYLMIKYFCDFLVWSWGCVIMICYVGKVIRVREEGLVVVVRVVRWRG